jgi:hypothetical protein
MTTELRKAAENRTRAIAAARQAAEQIAREREERLARERATPTVTAEPLPEGPIGSGGAS